jgi:hypothetical protein
VLLVLGYKFVIFAKINKMRRKRASHIVKFFILSLLLAVRGIAMAQTHKSVDADTLRGKVLQEITVHRTKEHYSKRNNPAVDFVNKIRSARELNDPKRNAYYSYRKYERNSLGLSDFRMPDSVSSGRKPGKFDFLREHVDTSDVTGLPILPLTVKEKVSDVFYRKSPQAEKQQVQAIKQQGIDDIADLKNIQVMIEDVFREVDLYDDDINILQNRFVSPLSRIAPDFYKFYLTDTAYVDNVKCIVLSFAPRNPSTFGFLGRLYVEAGDTTMFVKKVAMGVSPTINLNFVDRLQINQRFEKAPDGSRLKMLDDMNVEISVIKGMQRMYARRTTAYSNHSFAALQGTDADVFNRLGDEFVAPDAYSQPDDYWARERLVAMGRNEGRMSLLLERLRGVNLYKYAEELVKLMVVGYVHTGNPSKFDVGPLNTMISGNTVEGARFRLGGITTANLSEHWFARGYVAYGTRDEKWKYSGELEYSFNAKKYHSREFPIHSVKLNHKYDIDQLGQHYMFTNADNVFLALKRCSNDMITYRRDTELCYQLELANNFSVQASIDFQRQEPGPYVPLALADGTLLNHYDETLMSVQLRYAPGEKFYQTKSSRIPINLDAPVIVLTHTFAPKGFGGSRYAVNKTELSLQKRVWFSAFGFADVQIKGGHVWSRSPYINLLTPNANLSYTIQPESFALLNPLEFINDSYASWDVTYWANGALFNLIPYFKKLKLREVVAFRGWWGELSEKNNPMVALGNNNDNSLLLFPTAVTTYNMQNRPYMEVSAGVDNLFKCLRVDHVWRLTYRSVPGVDRNGWRVALHITF